MQAVTLELLEKEFSPSQARTLATAIDFELEGTRLQLATKHDLNTSSISMRSDLDAAVRSMRVELAEAVASMKSELTLTANRLEIKIVESKNEMLKWVVAFVTSALTINLGVIYFLFRHGNT
jgi:hypothetical protein